MRAIRVERFGGPEALRLVSMEPPAPGPGEVLVRVAAAGVNPVDWKVRAGGAGERFGRPPYVPGWDVAGVVGATGDEVSAVAVGDEVFGMPRFPEPAGCYADYLCAPAEHLAAAPAGMDRVAAAGLPMAGLTGLQVLDLAGVTEGQRVLVHAAAGGVGHLAVQLAKVRGAHVIGTARADKHPFLYELGIDEAVDHTMVAFEEAVEDVDVVINPVRGDYGRRSLRVLGPGGVLVMIVGSGDQVLAAAAEDAGVRVEWHLVRPDTRGLARLSALADGGGLRVAVEHLLPLEQAARAHELGERGRTRGKIVLAVAG